MHLDPPKGYLALSTKENGPGYEFRLANAQEIYLLKTIKPTTILRCELSEHELCPAYLKLFSFSVIFVRSKVTVHFCLTCKLEFVLRDQPVA